MRSYTTWGLVAMPLLLLVPVACSSGPQEKEQRQLTQTLQPTATPVPLSGAELGKSLSARNGCAACHTIDGGPGVGPTWKGLFGNEQTLSNGKSVTANDAYLHKSIVDPDAEIVKGFSEGIMPRGIGDRLSEDEIQAIIEYIKAVK